MYLLGQSPPSVNMYWRRFAIADIPLSTPEAFEVWLRNRWYEKDELMETYLTTGRFPANIEPSDGAHEEFIETEVKLAHWYEVGNIFVVIAALALIYNLVMRAWHSIAG